MNFTDMVSSSNGIFLVLSLLLIPSSMVCFSTNPFTRFKKRGRSPRLLAAQTTADEIRQLLPVEAVHVIVLVHGLMGNADEMGYLEQKLKQLALAEKNNNNREQQQPFLIHSVVANEGRTADGIAKGGKRVAKEVNELLSRLAMGDVTVTNNDDMNDRETAETNNNSSSGNPTITLSFVGHSLGGLYARYALKDIMFNRRRHPLVQPKVFCTTATPHLGVGQHTYFQSYFKVPRAIEYIAAKVLRSTGSDLFRFTNVVQDLCCRPEFVVPLRQFEHRLAYLNAFSTDFQVPMATAGFLTPTDERPTHRRVVNENTMRHSTTNGNPMEVARFETKRMEELPDHTVSSDGRTVDNTMSPLELAQRLDEMGWTKVFCDVREHLWSIKNPFSKKASEDDYEAIDSSESSSDDYILSSAELLRRFGAGVSPKWHVPFGHTLLIVNSKSPAYAAMNAGGQPNMDQLAGELLEWILSKPAVSRNTSTASMMTSSTCNTTLTPTDIS